MKITTLVENNSFNELLESEHGLSLFVEIDNLKILFDTGKTNLFLINAKKLNVDLTNLDYVIISHAHYDHSNGMKYLKGRKDIITENTKIILAKDFFHKKYAFRKNEYDYNGINFKKDDFKNYKFVNDIEEFNNFIIFRNFKKSNSIETVSDGFYRKDGKQYIKDTFDDEIVLGLKTDKGLFLICGCSHIGLINILTDIEKNYKVCGVMAGAHLSKCSEERIDFTVNKLKEKQYNYVSLMHCSGKRAEDKAKNTINEFFKTSVGSIFEI